MRDQPVVAGRRILVVEPPRRRRAIDADVGVVHDAVAGTELERADEAPLAYRQRDDEDPEDIGPFRRQGVRWRTDDEIGNAELPAAAGRGQRRSIACGPFCRALVHPLLNRGDFGGRQPLLADEVAVAGLGFARRHGARARDGGNLRRAPPHLVECQDAEWTGAVRLVAGRAVTEEDRRDIPSECRLRECGPRQADDRRTDHEGRQPPRHQHAAYRNRTVLSGASQN